MPSAITPMKIRPTISMPVITFLPSSAASATKIEMKASTGATLPQPPGVRDERARDRLVPRGVPRQPLQRAGIAVVAERRARVVQPPGAEQRRGGGPRRAVAVAVVRPRLGAERDQLGQVADRRHVA